MESLFPSSQVKLSHLISVKLDDKNFKQWKQQIDGVVRGHRLQRFVTVPVIPSPSPSDPASHSAFLEWEQQDALICTWLLSTISDSLLPKLVECKHAWQVWTEIHRYFDTLLSTKARQLRSELRRLTKGTLTIEELMKRTREISESLVSIGDPVPLRNLIEIVLDSLPEEYDSIVASVNSKDELSSLDELESSLLAHESRLEKHRKVAVAEPATVNLTQAASSPAPVAADQVATEAFPQGTSHVTANAENHTYGSRGGRSGRGGGRFGRGGGRFGKQSCQICHKSGHDASVCYYRYSNSSGAGYSQQRAPFNPFLVAPRAMYPVQFAYASPRAAPPRSSAPQAPQAFYAGTETNSNNLWWYPDSGASHHVTPEASNVSDSASVPGSEQVFIGNGQGLSINSVGSMSFSLPHKPHLSLILSNLLHVPQITKNLMSVSKFAQDNNVFFEFHPTFCVVKSQATSEVLLSGRVGDDGLYKFPNPAASPLSKSCPSLHTCSSSSSLFCSPAISSCNTPHCMSNLTLPCNESFNNNTTSTFLNSSLNSATVSTDLPLSHSNSSAAIATNKYVLWHTRLGHPNHHALVEIFKLCKLAIPSKPPTEMCHACCIGKSHRLPSSLSTTVYTHPFELVVCDLWGPAPMQSSSGYTYFLTCVDAFSRFVWVFPLKLKSDTMLQFLQFKKMVELQFNCSIKCVQTDGGGEFRPLTKYLTNLGIVHRFTCPHTHHQNGLVERKHRHIVETGLTLLAQSTLPLKFWDHAFVTAAYLINRIPSPILNNTSPYYKLLNKPPDYSTLKVFGCACYPFLRPYNTHKLAYRSQQCIFLGYSSSHKGYKCLASDGHIYISKDVVFHEALFPYSSLFPNSSKTSVPSLVSSSATSVPPLSIPSAASQSSSSISQSLSSNSPSNHAGSHSPTPCSPPSNTSGSSPESSTSASQQMVTPVPQPLTAIPAPSSPSISPALILTDPAETSTISPSSSHNLSEPATSSPNLSHPTSSLPFIHPQNVHPMQTRAKRGITLPRLHPTLLLTHMAPTSVGQALAAPHWFQAMQEEYQALMRNQTWTLVKAPDCRKPIGCKWVFRTKENPDGSINRYKARLVAKGFHQRAGSDFQETFSPVIKPVTVRIILTIAVSNKWTIQQIDVNNAFLNGTLEEEVFMQQPPGFEAADKSLVCKLNRAIYGLKQAPRAWFDKLKSALVQLGFQASRCDPSLFLLHQGKLQVMILVYVDDIIITGSSAPFITSLIKHLNNKFSLKQLGQLDYFLGLEVSHLSNGSLLLSQTKYISDLLTKLNMLNANGMPTPMVSSSKLSKVGSAAVEDPTHFRSVVGALQYATLTRPEISFSVNKVCQFLSNPLEDHWKAVKRILRYLSGTLHHGLLIQPAPVQQPMQLLGFCDADWASDPDDRRSTSGACIYLGPNVVSWWSKKQQLVARSSAEAEYRSMAQLAAELIWIQSLLQELHCSCQVPRILCDNLSTVTLAHNPILHNRTKHMELDIFFLREKVLSKHLSVVHVPAHDQWADILTKPLSAAKFVPLRSKLRVLDKIALKHPPADSKGD